MSEELQQKLRDQLWEVANRLRGNMSASDFMYFTLGFIFYKYLSEKIENFVNGELEDDEVSFKELWNMDDEDTAELQEEVKDLCLSEIGYFIEPQYLFSSVIESTRRKRTSSRCWSVHLNVLRIVHSDVTVKRILADYSPI